VRSDNAEDVQTFILSFSETDFRPVFYVMTAFLALTTLLVLKLKVSRIDTKEKTINSLRKIATKPAIVLYFLVGMMGFGWGIQDSYLIVYLQKEMQATTAIIS
jgi:hypothetical protein